ncbi:hypothetical protein J4H86_18920 [Spiractinospora alimapuensis]|uniref:hypothetical protein n=1 Tax=Spiractinospora alimapuensis TaxID=2820884 RepID=UPI001F4744F6|nr:hypothetical protein [Spiractinospora alimapuensis]QVQ50917.1 hypothetical protein J4H86_18920 [Spiractinospora alimapuensis]
MIVVPVGIMMEMWWLIVITPPAAIGAAALTMLITRAVGGNQAIRRGLGVAASTLGTAVGLFVVWFGVSSFLNADTCDPQIARCVVVINGVMSGESTESVRGQLFSAFMLSLAFILPGLLLIGFCVRTIVKTFRSKTAAN